VSGERDDLRVQRPLPHGHSERGHTRGLDPSVDALVVRTKMFKVRAVAWAGRVVDCHDQTRRTAPHTAGGLDVLRGGLWLADYSHEAEAWYVQTDLNHVRCQA